MPPTLKDSSALPFASEGLERTAPGAADAPNAQPMALEVPVTVNGTKTLEGGEKREPFSETTTTVLILANGAVIRLAACVEPGQRVSLTNEKTKKEIVCQVVKSKSARTASGYVEVEFTQPVQGFWGTRFPSERNATQPSTSASAPRKLDPDPSVSGIPTITAPPKSTTFTDAPPSAMEFNSSLADPVQDLKTEIKADSRSSSKADFLAPAEAPAGAPKLESNRLQEQLSALLAAEQEQIESPLPAKIELGDTAAKIFDIVAQEPVAKLDAPAKSDADPLALTKTTSAPATSSFDNEKVQIPAWLEPLARNAAIPAPPAELDASDSTHQFNEFEVDKPAPPVPDHKLAKAAPKASSSLPAHVPAAPLFGKTLLDHTPELARPRGSNKGLWLAVAAALLLSAASGAWYFRDELALLVAQRTNSPSRSSAISPANASVPPATPVHTAPLTAPSAPAASTPDTPSSVAAKPSSERTPAAQPTSNSSPSQARMETAAITERIPKSNSSSANDAVSADVNSVEIVEPEARKSLGKVRLAKPKVSHSANSQANGVMAPSLDSSNEASSEDQNPLSANLATSSNQPAAPVNVGGDVTPARMISSVPPVYPALAKTQHISGDVRVDALIDGTGRVTTMKVISGPSLLHQAAMDALRQWKYQPASLDGKPASMHLTVTIQFRLQ